MKKFFTSFLTLMLLFAAGVNAQYKPAKTAVPQEGESYLLSTTVSDVDYFVTYKGGMKSIASDDSYLWQIVPAGDGNYYLMSAETGLYIQEYDQLVLSEDQGGYPFDGYDVFGYAGFNFTMGDKATAMKITLNGDGVYIIDRTQRVPAMEGYGYDLYQLEVQEHDGVVNVAMAPWKSNCKWYFYTTDARTAKDDLIDLIMELAEVESSFVAGTTPGTYEASAVEAFRSAYDEAFDKAEDPEFTDWQTLLDRLSAAYAAVQKAVVRIPAGYYYLPSAFAGFEQQQGVIKAIYEQDGNGMWGTINREDASYIWKITPVEGEDPTLYSMTNAFSGRHFSDVQQSANISLTDAEDGVYTVFEVGFTADGVTGWDIRPTTSPKGGYRYIHAGGHNSGAGSGANLVGWIPTTGEGGGATEWALELVPDDFVESLLNTKGEEEAQKALNQELGALIAASYDRYLATGEYTKGDALLTQASQFSSPFSQNDLGDPDGSDLSAGPLIDNNPDTYWHSYWGGGSLPGNSHYLQVELAEPLDCPVELYVQRRVAANDHVSVSDVYGSNDGENWTYLTQLTLGNVGSGQEWTTGVFSTGGFKNLRFWATETESNRGYFHYAEFQLYAMNMVPGCQLDQIKDMPAAQALMEAIAKASAIENATREDIDALQAALDAFAAISADPSEFKAIFDPIARYAENAVVGTEPGCVDGDALAALKTQVEAATTMFNSGSYTAASLAEAATGLLAAREAAAPIEVVPGKWYNIVVGEDGYVWSPISGNKVNQVLYVEGDATSQESQWRFLDYGDGTYLLQNRATGRSLGSGGTYNYAYANYWTNHCVYTLEYNGDATTSFRISSWKNEDWGSLEIYGDTNIISHNTAGTPLRIVAAAEDGEEDNLATPINFGNGNRAVIYTLPTGLKNVEGVDCYKVNGVYEDEEGLKLSLRTVKFEEETVAPGEPVLMMVGDYDADLDTLKSVPATLVFGDAATKIPMEVKGGLVGVMGTTDSKVVSGELLYIQNDVTKENAGKVVYQGTGAAISNFRGYVALDTMVEEGEGDLIITVPGAPEGVLTGVERVFSDLTKAGNVYNAAGQLVAKNATLRDVKRMGKGLYILNGVKVLVK